MKTNYTSIELDSRDDANEIQKILGEITGAKTVKNLSGDQIVFLSVVFYIN